MRITLFSFTIVFQSQQAHAIPICNLHPNAGTTKPYPLTTYVENGQTKGYFYVCFQNPDPIRLADALYTVQVRLTYRSNLTLLEKPGDFIKSQKVRFYYFANRADSIAYMQNTAPYNAVGNKVFYDSTSRCGNTGYRLYSNGFNDIFDIAVSFYDKCTVNGNSNYLNPSLIRTVMHEAGHAFDFSLASRKLSTVTPSSSRAFLTLKNEDLDELTPLTWASKTVTQKALLICDMTGYGINKPERFFSDLEKDFAQAAGGASAATKNQSVCSSSGKINTAFIGLDPQQIVMERIPYFTTTRDVWAEEFAIRLLGTSPDNFLGYTDTILSYPRNTPPNFTCTRLVLDRYIFTAAPPTSIDLASKGCNSNPGSFTTR